MSRPGDNIGNRPSGSEVDEVAANSSSALDSGNSDRLLRIILAGISAVFGAGVIAYVVRYGRNLFYWDDNELIFGLTGQQPTDLGWFFTWQNEHLVAMVRFVFFVVWKMTADTRVMMLLICVGLIAATLFLLDTARLVRGRADWTDAAIPLLLLSWSHYQNLIFPLQFFFAWSVTFACACLWAFIRSRYEWRWPELILVLVVLPLLPLNGVFGAIFAVPFVLLCVRTSFERGLNRDDRSLRDAAMLGFASAATIGTLIVNYSGYRPVANHPRAESLTLVISAISEVLAVGVGPAGIPTWPAAGIAVGALCIGALAVLAISRRESAPSRRVIESLAASLIGFLLLVCAIGFGRAGLGPTAGFASRYSIFSAVLICVALIAISVRWNRRASRAVAVLITAAAIAAQPMALVTGREYGRDIARVSDRILSDLANGVPIEVVAHRDGLRIYPSGVGMTRFLRALADSGQGSVGRRAHGRMPCNREFPVTMSIEVAHSMEWDGKRAECTGEDPYTVFNLPAPVRICAVRIRFRLVDADPETLRVPMQTFWSQTSRNDFTPYERNETTLVDSKPGELQTVTYWVGDTIDRFRIDPGTGNCQFELVDFTLVTQ